MAKLLLLTGQRLNEVAQMTDAEVAGGLWHLSNDRTKNARAHDVPLSEAAAAVLSDVKRIKGRYGYVFTTTGESAVQGFHKGKAHIAGAMEAIAKEDTGQAVVIPHWGFHDLRRTTATGMARLGVPVRVTEAVLWAAELDPDDYRVGHTKLFFKVDGRPFCEFHPLYFSPTFHPLQ
jgi:integrase